MTAEYPTTQLGTEERLLLRIFGKSAPQIVAPSADEVEKALSRLREFEEEKGRLREAWARWSRILKEQRADVLSLLTPRERKVLELRFGLEDGRNRTLKEVGREFKVSGERIRQIEAEALRELRHPTRSKGLSDDLNDESGEAEPSPSELSEFKFHLSTVRRAESYGWPHQDWVAELNTYVFGAREP